MNKNRPPRTDQYVLFTAILVCVLLLTGCNLPGSPSETVNTNEEMSIEEALAVQPEDRRVTMLEKMGAPDTFSIRFESVEDQVVRWETWSYFDYQSAMDFVDGELLWTVDLDPVPDGSLYAHYYNPQDFRAHMSPDEVRQLLDWQQLEEIDLGEADLENGLVLIGDQIMLGFDQDRLVYVETLILAPQAEGQGGIPLPVEAPQSGSAGAADTPDTGAPTPRPTGVLILEDDFEAGDPLASPIFGAEFMAFGHRNGRGELTSKIAQGVVVAAYDTPVAQDFILEFDLKTEGLAPGAVAGLLFRGYPARSPSRYYNLTVRHSDNYIGLESWKDGQWVLRDFRPIPPALISQDGSYRLRLEAQGSSYRVFLEGSFFAEFSDDQILDEGYFGLTLVTSQPPQAATFDNFRVYRLP